MKIKAHLVIKGPNTQWGAATSASTMNRRVGTLGRSSAWCWIPNEGWVRWKELKAQVDWAFEAWRVRRSLAGKKTWDGLEARAAEIEMAMKRKLAA